MTISKFIHRVLEIMDLRFVSDGQKAEHKKEIFAMKVIRKSDMLRNSQEGHLRAERDFLVSAEGSQWYASGRYMSRQDLT